MSVLGKTPNAGLRCRLTYPHPSSREPLMKHPENAVIRRSDYRAPALWIGSNFASISIPRHPRRIDPFPALQRGCWRRMPALELCGADLTLVSIHLNGEPLPASAWQNPGTATGSSSRLRF